jgi:transposase-like protein
MNQVCPNCGSQDIENAHNQFLCRYCGFTFSSTNSFTTAPSSQMNQVINEPVIVLKKISIGKIKDSKDGTLYHQEQISQQKDDEIVKTSIREFRESGSMIFHSDSEASALCKCGNLISQNEFSRCSFGHEPICGKCARIYKDKTYCPSSYWLMRIINAIYYIVKLFFNIIGQILSVLFLKD